MKWTAEDIINSRGTCKIGSPGRGESLQEPRAVATGCYVQLAIYDFLGKRAFGNAVECGIRSLPLAVL